MAQVHQPPHGNGTAGGFVGRVKDEFGVFTTEASSIGRDLQELATKELELLNAEVAEQRTIASRLGLLGAVAATFGLLTLAFLAVTLFLTLDSFMDAAVAALVTSCVLAAVATVAGLLAYRHSKRLTFTPRRTINSLREDAQWIGDLIRSNMR
jgi:uncharacterized membrane protein YqjE